MTARCSLLFVAISTAAAVAQMAPAPGGTFAMGGTQGDADETPVHRVTVSPFLIDKTEVTYAQYDSCVTAQKCTPAHYDDGACVIWTNEGFKKVRVPQGFRDPQFPVVCVTWFQAQQYCMRAGKKLPSEAQWEYAALAGRSETYAWGDESPSAGRCTQSGLMHPEKAGTFAPHPWGLFDMTGNVWEWTADHYSPDYYSVSPVKDPSGAEVGQYRSIRGGGWYSDARQLRVQNRHWFEPNFGEVSIGFRCVKQ
jgi:formylglycine-generating enzyme required for sulfatase activity